MRQRRVLSLTEQTEVFQSKRTAVWTNDNSVSRRSQISKGYWGLGRLVTLPPQLDDDGSDNCGIREGKDLSVLIDESLLRVQE